MKSKLIISVLASLLFFIACQDKEKEEAISAIKQWMGKEILFPKNSVFTIRGKDTIDFALNVSDYKIVSYIDTAGCTKVDYPKTPTPPGGTLKFTITYDADKPGYFNKSLKVYGNMEGSPIKLFVTGETH